MAERTRKSRPEPVPPSPPKDGRQAFIPFLERAAARARAEADQSAERQRSEGKLDIIPLPQRSSKPFRSEITIEQTPIFVANSFQGEARSYERRLIAPETGEPIVQRIIVGKMNENDRERGVLRQVHQEIFYNLCKLWGDAGYPLLEYEGRRYGGFSMGGYDLVMALRGNDSSKHYERVEQLLQDLTSIPIVRQHHFEWQDTVESLKFTLLNGVTWTERGIDPKTRRPRPGGRSMVTIYFSHVVTEGFLHRKVKQLLLGPYEQLGTGARQRAEIARLLYPLLDHELSTKDEYHCRLDSLAERFGLTRYPYKSRRREKFLPATRALDGKPILGERYLLEVELRESSDGEDYVLVARRRQRQPELPL